MTTVRRKIPEGFHCVNCRGYKPADCNGYTVEDELLNRELDHSDYLWGYVIDHNCEIIALLYWPKKLGVAIPLYLVLDVSDEEAERVLPFYTHAMVIGRCLRTRAMDRWHRENGGN